MLQNQVVVVTVIIYSCWREQRYKVMTIICFELNVVLNSALASLVNS